MAAQHLAETTASTVRPSPTQTQGTTENAAATAVWIVVIALVAVLTTLALAWMVRWRGPRRPADRHPDRPLANP